MTKSIKNFSIIIIFVSLWINTEFHHTLGMNNKNNNNFNKATKSRIFRESLILKNKKKKKNSFDDE